MSGFPAPFTMTTLPGKGSIPNQVQPFFIYRARSTLSLP